MVSMKSGISQMSSINIKQKNVKILHLMDIAIMEWDVNFYIDNLIKIKENIRKY